MEATVLNQLFEKHYGELNLRATRQLRRWAGRLALEPSELIHLLFEKMSENGVVETNDDDGFLNLAERQMNWLLTDHYRHGQRQIRGGQHRHMSIDDFKG